MSSLFFLKFLPSGLTLFNGEANSASNVVPVGTEAAVGDAFSWVVVVLKEVCRKKNG